MLQINNEIIGKIYVEDRMYFLCQHDRDEKADQLWNPPNSEDVFSVVAFSKRLSCRRMESRNKRISKRRFRIKLDVASDIEMVHDKIEKNERQDMDSRNYDSTARE